MILFVKLESNICTFVSDGNEKYSNDPNLFYYNIFKSAVA